MAATAIAARPGRTTHGRRRTRRLPWRGGERATPGPAGRHTRGRLAAQPVRARRAGGRARRRGLCHLMLVVGLDGGRCRPGGPVPDVDPRARHLLGRGRGRGVHHLRRRLWRHRHHLRRLPDLHPCRAGRRGPPRGAVLRRGGGIPVPSDVVRGQRRGRASPHRLRHLPGRHRVDPRSAGPAGDASLLEPGEEGSFDSDGASAPTVILDGDVYKMWYTGIGPDESIQGFGLATSTDGLHWTKVPGPAEGARCSGSRVRRAPSTAAKPSPPSSSRTWPPTRRRAPASPSVRPATRCGTRASTPATATSTGSATPPPLTAWPGRRCPVPIRQAPCSASAPRARSTTPASACRT